MADASKAYETLKERGAQFLTPPLDRGFEVLGLKPPKRATDKSYPADQSELFDDELKARADERGEEVARARNVARMFRFVCPSNYIPGKQAWGAF